MRVKEVAAIPSDVRRDPIFETLIKATMRKAGLPLKELAISTDTPGTVRIWAGIGDGRTWEIEMTVEELMKGGLLDAYKTAED